MISSSVQLVLLLVLALTPGVERSFSECSERLSPLSIFEDSQFALELLTLKRVKSCETLDSEFNTAFVSNTSVSNSEEASEIVLKGSEAEVRGGDIQIEKPSGNIGYWHSTKDEVAWKVIVPAGKYDLYLDYASANDHQENQLQVEIAAKSIEWKVVGTGSWAKYKQVRMGSVELADEATGIRLTAKSLRQGEALCDLRTVLIVPAGEKPNWKKLIPEVESADDYAAKEPKAVAAAILNESLDAQLREELTDRCDERVDKIMKELVEGLGNDLQEEYRRIPWIWRVAIRSTKRNNAQVIEKLIAVSIPDGNEKLRDWQAVVLGGGVINGLGLIGLYPQQRIEEILQGKEELLQKYRSALDQATLMAENEKVANGTRYDALRMVAMLPWAKARPILTKYIQADVNAELQMGAMSGLVDLPNREAEELLMASLAGLTESNRQMALDGLVRSKDRRDLLIKNIKTGVVKESWLSQSQKEILQVTNR